MNNRLGLTLIEIIVSFAILGLVALSALSIFDIGLMNIINARELTENTHYVTSKLDKQISEWTIVQTVETSVNIKISNEIQKEVSGEIIHSENIDDNGKLYKLETFIPLN